jgi:hypothetical protein
LVELMVALCGKLASMRQGAMSTDAGAGRDSSVVDNSMERLLVIMADVTTDRRLKFVHSECEACLRSLSASSDSHQQLRDLSNLRRIDSFLHTVGSLELELDSPDADVKGILEHCISSVHEVACDSKRSTAMVMFYLDSSANKLPLATIPIHCIDEALPEGVHGKGNIAALVHLLRLSSDSVIIRDVLRFFRTILDKPSSAALARLKPLVRRNVAETLAVAGRVELRLLLGKLLLYRGMDAPAAPATLVSAGKDAAGSAAGPTNTETTNSTGPAPSGAAGETVVEGKEGLACGSPEATAQRRSTLRLLTLVLDGVDESIDRFAAVLVEALLDFVPELIRMPRPVLKECFAGIKFVCFRKSQACVERMIDLVLDALNKAAGKASTPPEAAANLADMLSGLVASFQSVSRQPFSDLGSVTSAHVRASDTLSTVSTSSEVSNEGMSYTSRGESTVATSAVTYISSTGHMDPDDSSAVVSRWVVLG